MKKVILCGATYIALFTVSCNSIDTASKDVEINCDTNAIISNYLYKNHLIDSTHAFDKDIDFRTLIPAGILQTMYLPTTEEYNNPRMRKSDASSMISQYQLTRTGEVWSFRTNGIELKKYIDEVSGDGMTDMQFILAHQPPKAGQVADMTLIAVGSKLSGATWTHVYGTIGGTKEAVLQHVMPLRLGQYPSTVLE